MRSQLINHLSNTANKIRASTIHFINKTNPRDLILTSLTPNSFRLRFYTANGIENTNRTIENSQRPFHFSGKIHMTGSINYIDLMVLPETSCSCRGDSDSTLLLLLHPVHRCITVMHFTNFMTLTRVIKNTFSRCCLTSIDVSDDSYIPSFFRL